MPFSSSSQAWRQSTTPSKSAVAIGLHFSARMATEYDNLPTASACRQTSKRTEGKDPPQTEQCTGVCSWQKKQCLQPPHVHLEELNSMGDRDKGMGTAAGTELGALN